MTRPWAALTAMAVLLTAPVAGAATPGGVLGPDTLPFPSNPTSEPVVQAWMEHYLPVKGMVVGAWSPNVLMLVSAGKLVASDYPEVTTEVWSEVLTPDAAKGAGFRVAIATQTFQCEANLYRMDSVLYFQRGDRRGGFEQEIGGPEWESPDNGTVMDTVERAACFHAKRQLAAAASAPKPGPGGKRRPTRPAPEVTPSLRGLQPPQ